MAEADPHTNKEGSIGLDFWPHGLEEGAGRHDIEIHFVSEVTDLGTGHKQETQYSTTY